MPLDIQGAPVPEFLEDGPTPRHSTFQVKSSQDTLEALCRDLSSASRPLFIWGNGVKVAGAEAMAVQLIESLGLPSVFTWNASDILPYNHEYNFGRPGVVAQRHPNFIVQNADLVVSVGCSLDNVITAYNPSNFAPRAQKYIIDVDPEQLAAVAVAPATKINVSATEFLAYMLSKNEYLIYKNDVKIWTDKCTNLKNKYENDFPNVVEGQVKLSHKDAVLALSEALDPGQLIATGSSGLAIEAFYMMFRNKIGQKYFLTSGLGAMGYGLPASIGISVENPGRSVVLIESDGSLAMNVQELQTLSNRKLPVCICLMNNNGYASIRNTQENYFDRRYFGTGPEAGQNMPNWSNLAHAYNLKYREITKAGDIASSIRWFNQSKLPTVLDIRLASGEKLLPKCAAIQSVDGNIFSMPLEDMSPLLPIEEIKQIMDGNVAEVSLQARENG